MKFRKFRIGATRLKHIEVIYIPYWSYTEMRDPFGFTASDYIWFGGYPGPAEMIDLGCAWSGQILSFNKILGASSPKFQVFNTALMSATSPNRHIEIRSQPEIYGRWVESSIGIEVKSGRNKPSSGIPEFSRRFGPAKILLIGRGGIPIEEFLTITVSDLFS